MKAARFPSLALSMYLSCSLSAFVQSVSEGQIALRPSFESEYEAWRQDCDRARFSSLTSDRTKSEHFKNIVAMGPAVLPYLVEKRLQDPNFTWVGWAWLQIARVNTETAVNRWAKEPMVTWWRGGKKQATQRFDLLNDERKNLKAQGRLKEEAAMRGSIRALGIAALPQIMEQLKGGDPDLIETVEQLTEGASRVTGETADERIRSCLTWWENNKEKWLIPFPNKRPMADAGKDQRVPSGSNVPLDGSASRDEDKDGLLFHWRQIAGPPVELSDAQAARPVFTAPPVDKETILAFELVVNDGSPKNEVHPLCQSGESKPVNVRITVAPRR